MCPPPLWRLLIGLRDGQEPACAELRDEVCRVPEGSLRVHVELFTDPGDDGARRRLAVRRFPDQRPDRVQGVQRAAVRAEDDDLTVVDPPRCPGTLRQIRLSHCRPPTRTSCPAQTRATNTTRCRRCEQKHMQTASVYPPSYR